MDITNPNIVEYLLSIAPERDKVLQEMEKYALERTFPIVGPLVGKFLYLLTLATHPRRILELGSGFGYSAYWFAKGVGKEGEILGIERNKENADRALEYLKRGKFTTKINFRVGEALEIIDEVDGQFDLIFNDIDKHQYPKIFRKIIPRLRKGGIFITDNVLYSGKILERKPDADTAGILTYNRLITSSRDITTSIIPIRDGVAISVKL